jgi:hypothetical protein
MNRRDFLALSCIAAPAGALAAATGSDEAEDKHYFELRRYVLASDAKRTGLDTFLGAAAIPALNRLGIAPVGAFAFAEPGINDVYVLLPHANLESVATARRRLMADPVFLKDGAAFLGAPKADPAYTRVESSLMVAFDEMPKLDRPATGPSRIFQLRIYESHSDEKALKKIHMFNEGGEIAIFRRTGLTPVFFGESLVGVKLPNLTYMLGFEDMDAGRESWAKFRADEAWSKLKADPMYRDTVSNITNIYLKPLPSSQI